MWESSPRPSWGFALLVGRPSSKLWWLEPIGLVRRGQQKVATCGDLAGWHRRWLSLEHFSWCWRSPLLRWIFGGKFVCIILGAGGRAGRQVTTTTIRCRFSFSRCYPEDIQFVWLSKNVEVFRLSAWLGGAWVFVALLDIVALRLLVKN